MAAHPLVRRGTRLLGASYALAVTAFTMVAGPGSAAAARLGGDVGLSGLFFATYLVGSAAGAALGGRAMDRRGRRPVLAAAHVAGAAGFAAAGLGVGLGSLAGSSAGWRSSPWGWGPQG